MNDNSINVPSLRSTLARFSESLYLDAVPIWGSTVSQSTRWPPHFMKLSIVAIIGLLMSFNSSGTLVTAVGGLIASVGIAGIPVATYLTYSGRSYEINQGRVVQNPGKIGSRDEVNLQDVDKAAVSEGFSGKILGVGKVVLMDSQGRSLMQMDYLDEPEQVQDLVNSSLTY